VDIRRKGSSLRVSSSIEFMTAESSLPELLRLYDIYSDKKFSEIVASRGKVVTSYSGDSLRKYSAS
jgi:hypothetical protein